jgi:hypothetical protein
MGNMIKKAVFSLYNPVGINSSCGFNTLKDCLASTVLAILIAKKHFKRVEFTTDKMFKEIFEKFGLPIDDLNAELEHLKSFVDKYFWAYGKLVAYTKQTEPFLHIDNDVFMLSGLPEAAHKYDLIFQSNEWFNRKGYHYYDPLIEVYDSAPVKCKKIKHVKNRYAYNCGICGGYDLEHFKEWKRCSERYIFAPENQLHFYKDNNKMLIHQNLMHEQYFNACLIESKGMRDRVFVLGDEVDEINRNGVEYAHLWGTTKREKENIDRVWRRLNRDYPKIYKKVQQFNVLDYKKS